MIFSCFRDFMIKNDFIQFNFVLKKITKKTGKRGKSGEIFYLKHPIGRILGRERSIKISNKRGKSGKILFKTSSWVIFGRERNLKSYSKRGKPGKYSI